MGFQILCLIVTDFRGTGRRKRNKGVVSLMEKIKIEGVRHRERERNRKKEKEREKVRGRGRENPMV